MGRCLYGGWAFSGAEYWGCPGSPELFVGDFSVVKEPYRFIWEQGFHPEALGQGLIRDQHTLQELSLGSRFGSGVGCVGAGRPEQKARYPCLSGL